MPPWKAEPGFGSFHDERRLKDADIDKIAAWAEAGAPEGNAKDLRPSPRFPEGWQLGTPDLVLKVPEPFDVPAEGQDIYRCFVIPIPIDEDKTVAAFEFRPGNRRVVHHALLYLDNTRRRTAQRRGRTGAGICQFRRPGHHSDRRPGRLGPRRDAAASARGHGQVRAQRERPGAPGALPSRWQARDKTSRSSAFISPGSRPPGSWAGSPSAPRSLDIPAGDSHYHATAQSEPLPVDVQAIAIAPHMHYIGKEMKVVAETPDDKSLPLIWIKDWDFNWQGQYQFDNPSSSPREPSSSSTPITTTRPRIRAIRASHPKMCTGASRQPTRCACWACRL